MPDPSFPERQCRNTCIADESKYHIVAQNIFRRSLVQERLPIHFLEENKIRIGLDGNETRSSAEKPKKRDLSMGNTGDSVDSLSPPAIPYS